MAEKSLGKVLKHAELICPLVVAYCYDEFLKVAMVKKSLTMLS